MSACDCMAASPSARPNGMWAPGLPLPPGNAAVTSYQQRRHRIRTEPCSHSHLPRLLQMPFNFESELRDEPRKPTPQENTFLLGAKEARRENKRPACTPQTGLTQMPVYSTPAVLTTPFRSPALRPGRGDDDDGHGDVEAGGGSISTPG